MKITDLFLSNEDKKFIKNNSAEIKLASLSDRDRIVAQNLVKRGVLDISKDRKIVSQNELSRSIIQKSQRHSKDD